MFGTYIKCVTSYIKKIKNLNGNNATAIKKIFTDFTNLLEQKNNGYLVIGESSVLLHFVQFLFQIPSESLQNNTCFKNRLEIIKLFGTKFLMALSTALTYHCNPVLLKQYLSILPYLSRKLVDSESRKQTATLLQYYLKFFTQLWSINKHQMNLIKIDSCSYTGILRPQEIKGNSS
jgi:hypothetical protein